MGSIVRVLVVYLFLHLLFRISGKRTLSEMTTFDLLVLLIISETTQQAMVDRDNSLTNGLLMIATLVGLDLLMAWLKQRSPKIEKLIDGVPLVVAEDGKMVESVAVKERVDEDDVLEAARSKQGVGRMADIRYAILERDGSISIIPRE